MKSRVLNLIIGLGLVVGATGCGATYKTIIAHKGCDQRVAPPMKRPCHVCMERGTGWVFQPERPAGQRCRHR